ncbi:MAG: DNA methyltransferase, partial [Syntrophales bacterium]|nr:DNA methyltransferase [Syntrophales bacterium]
HCDPTASHYLKMLMDGIFGAGNFRNEISWRRSNPKSHIKVNFPNCRDVILRYSKSGETTFNMIYESHDPEYVRKAYKYTDSKGQYRLLPLLNPNDNRPNLTYEFLGVSRVWRWTKERMEQSYRDGVVVQLKPGAVPQYKKYLAESKGRTITDDWSDIEQAAGNEALGYPTQKPLALLERIINASCPEGGVVLDPFCGCGTTIAAAQALGRPWIGIDITHLAITLIKQRMKDSFGIEQSVRAIPSGKGETAKVEEAGAEYGSVTKRPFHVVGEPTSEPDAAALAASDPYQFQWWALGLVGARPVEQKKGADKGIDGRIIFQGDKKGTFESVILSVKAGHTNVAHIRDLKGVLEREKAAIGVLISMQEATSPMKTEAVTAGFYESALWGRKYQKMQLFTVAELLAGKTIEMPPIRQVGATFKKAPKATGQPGGDQHELL